MQITSAGFLLLSEMFLDRLRLGIVGYGDAAVSFVTAAHFLKDWSPVAVGGRNMDKASAFAGKYEITARTVEEIAESPYIDVVAIATPPGVHLQDTLTCLAGGKQMIVEKPIALTVEDCDRMIQAAQQADRLLMVAQTHRFYQSEIRVRELVVSGELGRLLMLEDTQIFDYFGPKRVGWQLDPALSGGGVVMNPTIHYTDRFRYFAGSEVKSVRALLGAARQDYEIEGHTHVLYTFEDKALSAALTQSGYGQSELDRTRLYFDRGMIQLDFYDNRISIFTDGKLLRTESPKPEPFGENRLNQGYVRQFVEFGKSIRGGAPLRSDGANGRANVAICLAIFESAARGVEVYPGL